MIYRYIKDDFNHGYQRITREPLEGDRVISSGTPEGPDYPFKIEGQDPLALSSLVKSSKVRRSAAEPMDS
jgi:hypothetical protein